MERLNALGKKRPIAGIEMAPGCIDAVMIMFGCGHRVKVHMRDSLMLSWWVRVFDAIEKGWMINAPCPSCPRGGDLGYIIRNSVA